MARLVAVAETGPPFVAALVRCWAAGDAVFPLDPRLPPEVAAGVLARVQPTHRWDARALRAEPVGGGRPVEAGDAVVLVTSGTTSEPKGVVLTHAAVQAAATAVSAHLGVDPATDRWLCCLPVAHAAGLGVVTRSLLTGTPVEVHAGFDAAAVEAAARGGATLVSLVPTALQRVDPSLFRHIVLGGSASPADRPAHAHATYGLTETAGGVVYDGRPLEGVEVRVVETQGSESSAPAGGGAVELRSPTLLRCYRTPDGDRDPRDAEGWFRTGDIGSVDADGTLRIDGRADDVIVTGGEKVWPDALEAVLRPVPGVGQVAAVGRPDPEWGQRVVAVVVPDGEPPTLEALRAAAKAAMPPWCAPKELELREALPTTPLGKVRRVALRSPPA